MSEPIVKAATAAAMREAAGPTTPRTVRRAVARRLRLGAQDEAVLIEKYEGCIATAMREADRSLQKDAADASDGDDAPATKVPAAGDPSSAEESASETEESFASAPTMNQRDAVEVLATLSGEEEKDSFFKRDKTLDALARVLECLRARLERERKAGNNEEAAATEDELEELTRRARPLLLRMQAPRHRDDAAS